MKSLSYSRQSPCSLKSLILFGTTEFANTEDSNAAVRGEGKTVIVPKVHYSQTTLKILLLGALHPTGGMTSRTDLEEREKGRGGREGGEGIKKSIQKLVVGGAWSREEIFMVVKIYVK